MPLPAEMRATTEPGGIVQSERMMRLSCGVSCVVPCHRPIPKASRYPTRWSSSQNRSQSSCPIMNPLSGQLRSLLYSQGQFPESRGEPRLRNLEPLLDNTLLSITVWFVGK
jgi:hypothetical protein